MQLSALHERSCCCSLFIVEILNGVSYHLWMAKAGLIKHNSGDPHSWNTHCSNDIIVSLMTSQLNSTDSMIAMMVWPTKGYTHFLSILSSPMRIWYTMDGTIFFFLLLLVQVHIFQLMFFGDAICDAMMPTMGARTIESECVNALEFDKRYDCVRASENDFVNYLSMEKWADQVCVHHCSITFHSRYNFNELWPCTRVQFSSFLSICFFYLFGFSDCPFDDTDSK